MGLTKYVVLNVLFRPIDLADGLFPTEQSELKRLIKFTNVAFMAATVMGPPPGEQRVTGAIV